MTYKVNGVQYIAVQAGWGGGGWGFVPPYAAAYSKGNANRILVFKLGGGEVPVPDDLPPLQPAPEPPAQDRKSTRLNSSHVKISYAVFCLKKKKKQKKNT